MEDIRAFKRGAMGSTHGSYRIYDKLSKAVNTKPSNLL